MKRKQLLGVLLSLAMLLSLLLTLGITLSAEEPTPTVSIDRFNLSFEDNIYIKYAVALDGVDANTLGEENFRLLFWTSPHETYTKGTEAGSVSTLGYQTINGKLYYIFAYTDLAAKQMTDDVYARAYVNVDGEVFYSDVEKYSILQYAYNKLGYTGTASTNANLKTLLGEMLSYGAAAQTYFGYKTDRLATERFYQVSVTNGTLTSDGMTHGLFLTGETVEITAPQLIENGAKVFSYWSDEDGLRVSSNATALLRVEDENKTYTASYKANCEGIGGVPALGHDLKTVSSRVEPTCETVGRTALLACQRQGCTHTEGGEEIPALGHDPKEFLPRIEPTCETAGKTAVMTCQRQGCTHVVSREDIPALGHDYRADVTAPTCTEKGYTTYTCKHDSSHTYVADEVAALGHVNGETQIENEIAATCTVPGSYDAVTYCVVCGIETERETVVTEAGHTPSVPETSEDVCNGIPVGHIVCTACGETISEHGHQYEIVRVQPTCGQQGSETHRCVNCGKTDVEILEALKHIPGDWVTVSAPKCDQTGSEVRDCLVCGVRLEKRAIDKIAHKFTSSVSDGWITYTCECGETYEEQAEEYVVISFVSGGNKILDDLHVPKSKKVELPQPESEKYVFAGWYYDEALTNIYDGSVFERDTTLYAAWGVDTLSGDADTNKIILDVPLDFTFDVRSDVKITDANIKNYIQITDVRGDTPTLYVLREGNGVYTVASNGYKNGMSYEVALKNGVEFTQTEGESLWFVTSGGERQEVEVKDGVILIPEGSVCSMYDDEEKRYIALAKDMLNVGDVFVVHGANINDVLLMAKVEEESYAHGFFLYTVSEAYSEDVFDKYEIFASEEVSTDGIVFSETAEEDITEAVMASDFYKEFEYAARAFSNARFGNNKYKLEHVYVSPRYSVSTSCVYLYLPFRAVFENGDDQFEIELTVKNVYQFEQTLVGSQSMFSFVLETNCVTDFQFSATNTPDQDMAMREFFRLLRNARIQGEFEDIDTTEAEISKTVVFAKIPYVVMGQKLTLEIGVDLNFEVVGEFEMSSRHEAVYRVAMRASLYDPLTFKTLASVSYRSSATFALAGKVQIAVSPSVKISLTLFEVLTFSARLVPGYYVEFGGIVNLLVADEKTEYLMCDGQVSFGVKVRIYVGVSALKILKKEWQVLSVDLPITFLCIGNSKVPLSFDSKDNHGIYDCSGTVDLKEHVDTSVTFYDIDGDQLIHETATDCLYFLDGVYDNISLTEEGILTYDLPLGEVVELQIKVVKNNIYKKIVVTLRSEHLEKESLYKAPTCTETGRTAYTYCANCGTVTKGENVEIATTEHEYESMVVAPTCKDKGYIRYSCVCHESYSEECAEPTGIHNFSEWQELPTACDGSEETYKIRICKDCLLEEYEGDPSHPHVFVTDKKEPTCTETGYIKLICEKCSYTSTETISKHGHYFTEWVTVKKENCTEGGLQLRKCAYCELLEEKQIPATGHTYGEWYVISKETCENDGMKRQDCQHCDVYREEKIPHHTQRVIETIDATCTERGYTTYQCSCGIIYNGNYKDPLGHIWHVATCTVPVTCARCKITEGDAMGHVMKLTAPQNDPTCLNKGKTALYTCERECGYTEGGEEIEALGHDMKEISPRIEPTCESAGKEAEHICTRECGYTEGGEAIKALGHDMKRESLRIEPTCESAGKEAEYRCKRECGYTRGGEEIEALGHSYKYHSAQKASCTNIGYAAYETCNRDGCEYSTYDVSSEIGMLPHTEGPEATCTTKQICTVCGCVLQEALGFTRMSTEEKYLKSPATCIAFAVYYYSCEKCGEKGTDTFVQLGFGEHNWINKVDKQYLKSEANCVSQAIYYQSCSVCGDSHDTEVFGYGPIHDEGPWEIDEVATCTKPGREYRECKKCYSLLEEKIIEVLPHNYLAESFPCTCLEDGYTEYTCDACGDKYRDGILPKYEHAPSATYYNENLAFHYRVCKYNYDRCHVIFDEAPHTLETELTTVQNAYGYDHTVKTYCTVCGYVEKEETVSTHEHRTTVQIPGRRPTCYEDGLTVGVKCGECEEILVAQTDIPKLEHSYFMGACIWCGSAEPSQGLSFTSNGDGTCYVSGIGTCTDTEIIIPSKSPEGDIVTGIGLEAFKNCGAITSVSIPDSVTDIASYAFWNCTKLTAIEISKNVTSIGESAFAGCTGIEAFTVATDNSVYHSAGASIIETASKTLVFGCKATVIPTDGSVTSIGTYAFSGCTRLSDIAIPESVKSIAYRAFYYCTSLADVYFDGSESEWSEIAISSGNEYLTNATIHYTEEITESQGLSFVSNGDGTCHVSGIGTCTDTEIIIPSKSPAGATVTGIGHGAFKNCTSIVSVTIPYGVKGIGNAAFYGCTGLTSIMIPNGVTSIGDVAFVGCTGLVGVTLPDSVTSIGFSVFENCTGLNNITIPNGVTSIGTSAFSGCTGLVSVTLPDSVMSIGLSAFKNCTSIVSITIPGGVTSIGDGAFAYCASLMSITIPDSVTSIGNSAFSGCTSLNSITIPDSVTIVYDYTFYGCTTLNSITIPNSVTSIRKNAFYGCTGLTSITIPDSVEFIASDAFNGCTELVSVTLGSGVTSIGMEAFAGCESLVSIVLPGSIKKIWDFAFSGCTSLNSITLPDSVTEIGGWAFERCTSLTDVYYGGTESEWSEISISSGNECLTNATIHFTESPTGSQGLSFVSNGDGTCYVSGIGTCTDTEIIIPSKSPAGDTVTSIVDYAFSDCTSLTKITIPEGVTSIENYTFWGCTCLTTIMIPDSVTSIKYGTFKGCTSLNSITIPDSVTSIGTEAFYECTSLTSITIPDSVTSIGTEAFYECTSLTSITIPDSVTSIGNGAFSGCTSLTSITIPNSVTNIGEYAFKDCTSLTSITIPDSVTSIGDNAFYRCESLTSITISDSATSIGDSVFLGCASLASITIPDSVTSIGGNAFWGCMSLASITVEDGNSVYHSAGNCLIETATGTVMAGCKNSVIPTDGSVTSIGSVAFYNCISLESLAIPDSVTSIGRWAFRGCTSLTDVYYGGTESEWSGITISSGNECLTNATIHFTESHTESQGLSFTSNGDGTCFVSGIGTCKDTKIIIPSKSPAGDTVTGIGDGAFADCTSLSGITIPDSVTSIGSVAFYNCISLESLAIPDSVISIGYGVLAGCGALETLAVDAGNPSYHSDGNCIMETSSMALIAGCKNSVIPNGVTSIGDVAFVGCTSLTSITIPDSVTSIGGSAFGNCTSLVNITLGSGVKSIGDFAFFGCTGLTSITIPDSVTSIGGSAFGNCTSLVNITLGSGVKSIGGGAFSNCESLTSITIPNSVTHIGSSAFSDCTGLVSVTLESGVTGIGGYMFSRCTGLESITIPNSVTSIGEYAFKDCTGLVSVTLESGVTSIGEYAFSGCTSLESITIPDSVTSIGSYAFSGCTSLESITIPDSVTSIGSYALFGCTALNQVTLENGVKGIGVRMFSGCTSLGSIAIPDSVTSIGNGAFSGCTSLTSITIPNSVTNIGSDAFSHCTGITSVNIGSGMKSIGEYMFYGCAGLTSITIPKNVTSIGKCAFCECTGLTRITIPDSVTSIGDAAFRWCTSLTSITIPNSVVSIGNTAFFYCPELNSITLPNTVTRIEDDTFSHCEKLENITIPKSVVSIGTGAFSLCKCLTDVYYGGTASEWSEITISSENEGLTNATIHFTESPTGS